MYKLINKETKEEWVDNDETFESLALLPNGKAKAIYTDGYEFWLMDIDMNEWDVVFPIEKGSI